MKKIFTLMAAMMLSVGVANAQLDKLLGNVASKVQSSTTNGSGILSTIGSVISSKLIPTSQQIVGTWDYQEPAVMFTSDNALKSAASSVASKSVEKKLQTYLSKVGITKGKLNINFAEDNSFTVTKSGKSVASGTYSLSGNDVSLTFKNKKQPCKVTPQLDNGTLVVVMDATKLKTFLEGIGSSISQLSTITSLMKGMDGMKLGIRLSKQ